MDVIKKMKKSGYNCHITLSKYVGSYFLAKFLPYAKVKARDSSRKLLNLRRIRATIATEWVKLDKEYEVMDMRPAPPNPLQHATVTMTIRKYAEDGADDEMEARKRCLKKYAEEKMIWAPWMAPYLSRSERKLKLN